jgi:type II secretory pathway pseudopilin PulG
MEQESQGRSGLSPAMLVVVTVILIAVAVGVNPSIIPKQQRKAADRTEAIYNIKQVSMMLTEFESEYGRFPDNETALEVKRRTKTDFSLTGEYSNDYFRQLLATGSDKSEKPFWSKTAQSPKKPDDNFSTPAKALEAGEVGFSYIMASPTQGQKAADEPSRPVVVTASYKFQTDWTFDPEVFSGKAVVLRLDNSATAMQIRQDNKKVSTSAGKTLGDIGDQTPWGTTMAPVLRAPLPRGSGTQ